MYQWLRAIGDLNRTGRMIVTCPMAQELFVVADLRSTPQRHEFKPDWILFDKALALSVTRKTHALTVLPELVGLCEDAMRGSYAQIVSLSHGDDRCFESKPLSLSASK